VNDDLCRARSYFCCRNQRLCSTLLDRLSALPDRDTQSRSWPANEGEPLGLVTWLAPSLQRKLILFEGRHAILYLRSIDDAMIVVP